MGSTKRKRLPAGAGELRNRINEWRRTRERLGPMSEELWADAVALARAHGVYCIAQGVGVSYESLRTRLEQSGAGESETGEVSGGFVELPLTKLPPMAAGEDRAGGAAQLEGSGAEAMTTVELTAADGARLTVRLRGCSRADVVGLAEAFWRRSA